MATWMDGFMFVMRLMPAVLGAITACVITVAVVFAASWFVLKGSAVLADIVIDAYRSFMRRRGL